MEIKYLKNVVVLLIITVALSGLLAPVYPTVEPIADDFLSVIREFFAEDTPEGCIVKTETVTVNDSLYLAEYCKVYYDEKLIGYVANVSLGGPVIGLSPDFTLRGAESRSGLTVEVVQGEVQITSGATPMTAATVEYSVKEAINTIKNMELGA